MNVGHLSKRFFGSLRPRRLNADERTWVDTQLLPTEQALFDRMDKADQRHAFLVGQRAEQFLGEHVSRPALAAAVLHDVGKVEARIGTGLRVVATLVEQAATREQIEAWAEQDGWLGRAGRYLNHNNIGARLLTEAGSDPLTITWAREHEIPARHWTLPEPITDALYRADNL